MSRKILQWTTILREFSTLNVISISVFNDYNRWIEVHVVSLEPEHIFWNQTWFQQPFRYFGWFHHGFIETIFISERDFGLKMTKNEVSGLISHFYQLHNLLYTITASRKNWKQRNSSSWNWSWWPTTRELATPCPLHVFPR